MHLLFIRCLLNSNKIMSSSVQFSQSLKYLSITLEFAFACGLSRRLRFGYCFCLLAERN